MNHDDSTAARQIVEDSLDRCPHQAEPGYAAALAGKAHEQPRDDRIIHCTIESSFHAAQTTFQKFAQATELSRNETPYDPVIPPTQADHLPIPLSDRGDISSTTAQQEART
ncbi:hypothetical protein [Saccharopolyspora pogona]|uniref:hypothetical protein n=1 Tax=Saccharopolyspora pogona TaxID=333966 RepID=UPI00168326EC|nr:hypothetical protein [Saccharopolyspora pogona]